MILGLSACGNESTGTEGSTEPETTQADTTQTDVTENDSEVSETGETDGIAEEGNVLVVYYSASGNTERVANYIAAETDADVFELVPADEYTSDDLNWSDDDSRVVYEHENPDARDIELVADTVDNWESYDTVFIGILSGGE